MSPAHIIIERMVELSGTLQPTTYGRYEIAAPESGWDSLLASKKE